MSNLDFTTVVESHDAWVMTPTGAEVVETDEYRIARFPDRFPEPLRVQWVRTSRPAAEVLDEVIARASAYALPAAQVHVKLSAPDGFIDALRNRGATRQATSDALAAPLPWRTGSTPCRPIKVRWRTETETARDANTVGRAVFGGGESSDAELAQRATADRESIASGAGGAVVAYVDDRPVGVAGVHVVAGTARMWGGGVVKQFRGRGLYRALVDTRMEYAAAHGATSAIAQGNVDTSSPILQRLGFASYGQEYSYLLPIG
ncbi:MAG TPA: GNAT family N-acetyltransferase [Candidatus Stackebrandtia faecavium]|nr:GNAT family N-acetyltransferase [Candidatus Stackebrandtia faecavium]